MPVLTDGISTRMSGPCAYELCEAHESEELVVEECSNANCGNHVHHFCSNMLLDGDLTTRVCSKVCRRALGLCPPGDITSGDGVASSEQTEGKAATPRSKKQGWPATRSRPRQATIRSCAVKRTNLAKSSWTRLTTRAVAAESSPNGGASVYTHPGYSRAAAAKFKSPVTIVSSKTPVQSHSCSTDRPLASTGQPHVEPLMPKAASIGEDGGGRGCADLDSVRSYDGYLDEPNESVGEGDFGGANSSAGEASVEDENEAGAANIPATKMHTKKKTTKRKKFFFNQTADLALLEEILAIEPYAGVHGQIGTRYQAVADNLSRFLELDTKLSKRTVTERFNLLMEEFKTHDQSYRKKSGVDEKYEKHRQLLQDITDRMRDVTDQKKARKDKKKAKEDKLQSQGEILRDKAVKRRSERAPDPNAKSTD